MSYAPYGQSAYPNAGGYGTDPTAVTGRRVLAWFLDAIVYLVLSGIVNAIIGGGGSKSYNLSNTGETGQEFCDAWRASHSGFCFNSANSAYTVKSAGGGIVIFLVFFTLFCVVQGAFGGSVGKLALGLRVVKADGSLCGMGRSFGRTAMWIVDAITCGLPIVGGIAMFASKGHRRIGDMVAGTFVVPASQVGRPLAIAGLTPPQYSPMPNYPVGYGAPGQPGGPYPPAGVPAQPGGPYPPAGVPAQPGGPYPSAGAPGSYGGIGGPYPPAGAPGADQPPFGAPPAQPGYAAPAWPSPQAPTAPAPTAATPQADYQADTPTWDPKRNAYIQYDTARGSWLEHDTASGEWKPISQ